MTSAVYIALAVLAQAATPSATPQPDAPPPPNAAPPPGAPLSPAEQEAIQRALERDAAAARQGAPAAAPPAGDSTSAAGAEASSPVVGGAPPMSLNPDLSLIADVAGALFSVPRPLETGEHDPHARGFTVQQLELAASSAVDPYFQFNSFIVFKVPRPDGMGGVEPGGVEIEEVYATTTSLPANLQLRAGQFLTRFGRFNPTHPHTWDFVDQPLIIGKVFGGDGNRGVGAELSYLTPLPWYAEVLGSVTQDSSLALNGFRELQTLLGLRQFFPLSDDWSLLWGLSGTTRADADADGADHRTWIWGTDLYLKYRPVGYGTFTVVSLWVEWFLRRRDIPGDTLTDTGGFAQLFWRFAQRWGVAARYEAGTPSVNDAGHRQGECPVDALGVVDQDCLLLDTGAPWQRATANATFWPTEFSRLRLQGSATFAGVPDERATYALMLAFEFAVGPHGAHQF